MSNSKDPGDDDQTVREDSSLGADELTEAEQNPTLVDSITDDAATLVEPPQSDDSPTLVEQSTSDDRTVVESSIDDSKSLADSLADKTTVEPPENPAAADQTLPDDIPSQDSQTLIENFDDENTFVSAIDSPDTDDNPTLPTSTPGSVRDDDIATLSSHESGLSADSENTLLSGDGSSESSRPMSIQRLERFELIRVLGQGAFGTVYLARDPRLDRRVAIKVAKTGVLNSKSDIDRFNREARAAAALRHPNIVPVYEVGQLQGSMYIVYEFVEGTTLKAFMKEQGKVPPARAAELMATISRALEYAHAQGIIHRDIKPDNILLDKQGRPHIADFGLARNEEKDATRTREGTLMGTPAYMSPEQASGQVSKVDRRSDVWSLGIMLDEMLTGRRIFSGTVIEVLAAVQTQEVKPVRSIDPTLPIDLETICLKSLEREPQRRFQTAGEMADELELWSNGEPITLRRISTFERIYRWANRNQLIAALLATVFVTLALGAAVSTWFWADASQNYEQLVHSNNERRKSLLASLFTAEAGGLPSVLSNIETEGHQTDASLLELLEDVDDIKTERALARRAMLVMRLAPKSADAATALQTLRTALLHEQNDTEFRVIRDELIRHKAALIPKLWTALEDPDAEDNVRLHAAAALAKYDPDAAVRWAENGSGVASRLLSETSVARWAGLLRPARNHLQEPLSLVFRDKKDGKRNAAAIAIVSLFDNAPNVLVDLIEDADPWQVGLFARKLKNTDAAMALAHRLEKTYPESLPTENRNDRDRQRANHVLALLETGQVSRAKTELLLNGRNGVRTHFSHRAADADVTAATLFGFLKGEDDPVLLRTAILALARYSIAHIDQQTRNLLMPDLARQYTTHEDAGVHAAIEYLLRKWDPSSLSKLNEQLESAEWPTDGRRWHHAPSGIVFAIFRDPPEFIMGTDDPIRGESPPDEEIPHARQIKRSYAISLHEVTLGQFRKFRETHETRINNATGRHPVTRVNWSDAALFCNHLSGEAGLPETALGYSEKPFLGRPVATAYSDVVTRAGYRLPTSAEWEYAARGGTNTLRHFGSGNELLDLHAWTLSSGRQHPAQVGQLLPNQFGLFDSLGNVREWTQSWFAEAVRAEDSDVVDGDEKEKGNFTYREHRGGSLFEPAKDVIEAARFNGSANPRNFQEWLGFRVARTLSVDE